MSQRRELISMQLDRFRILEQDAWWIDRDGMRVPVDRIDSRYAFNIVRGLRRRAAWMQEVEHEALWFDSLLSEMGDENQMDIEAAILRSMDEPPLLWLSQKPLVRALMARIHPNRYEELERTPVERPIDELMDGMGYSHEDAFGD